MVVAILGQRWLSPRRSTAIEQALSRVMEPELHRDIVSLQMVRDIRVEDGAVSLRVVLTTPACPLTERIESDIRAALLGPVAGVTSVSRRLGQQRHLGGPRTARAPGDPRGQEHGGRQRRQGRGRQDHGERQRGDRARPGGRPRRTPGCGHLWPERADHDGPSRPARGRRVGEDDPALRLRHRGGQLRHHPQAGPAGDVARADAGQGDARVPLRGGVGASSTTWSSTCPRAPATSRSAWPNPSRSPAR